MVYCSPRREWNLVNLLKARDLVKISAIMSSVGI
jgi:hypothetical protein